MSFDEFAKLMMSLAAPPPPPQQLGAPGFSAGTSLGGGAERGYGAGYSAPYGGGGPGNPGGSYPGGLQASYPASTSAPLSSGNPVQARCAQCQARCLRRAKTTRANRTWRRSSA